MSVLVTGATGFIGSYLVPKLVENGHEVIATDRVPEPEWIKKMDSVRFIQADMGNEAEIQKLMGVSRPTRVLHLVSLLAGPCEENPILGYKINFMSTAALLDACLAYGVERFVMTSSTSVFGRGLPEPVLNDAERLPATVYGQTKVACENLMEWYRRKHGLSCGSVRYPWVYGPGRSTGITAEYSSKLLDKIARREKLVITEPEERGDWLYVKDAVKSLMLLIERDDQPEIAYNIMGGVFTVRQAMEIAREIFPDADIEIGDGKETSSPYPTSFDDSKAREDIGWSPDYTLQEGMREHVEILRSRMT